MNRRDEREEKNPKTIYRCLCLDLSSDELVVTISFVLVCLLSLQTNEQMLTILSTNEITFFFLIVNHLRQKKKETISLSLSSILQIRSR